MPISELIRDRKITPDQLAFPKELDGGGAGRSSSYQQTINAINETTTVNVTINEATDLVRGEVRHRMISERRAKDHVGSWHNAWRYELSGETFQINHRDYNLIPYGTADIANDGYNDHLGAFGFTVTKQTQGVYWCYAHFSVALTIPPEVFITFCRLAIFKNNALYSIIDHADLGMMTDGKDWVLKGGDMVHAKTGDIISFAFYPEISALENQTVSIPGECYGYCVGARMTCDPDGSNPVETGESFAFNN